jgi:hypothetical protein
MSATPTTFYNVLVEFTGNITTAFPANQGAKMAHNMLQMVGSMPQAHPEMVKMWYELSQPVIEDVKNKNPEPVAKALDNCPNTFIANINSTSILCNDEVSKENKESMWKFLQTLTALSQMVYPTLEDPSKPAPELPASAVRPVSTPPAAAVPPIASVDTVVPPTPPPTPVPQQQAQQAKTKPADVVKSITTAMPEIFKSLNELMKNPGDDNPLGSMLRQMMDPNALQTGMAPNVGANLMQRDPGPAMAQVAGETGMGADEIMKKLARLELYEKARAKRKGKKN